MLTLLRRLFIKNYKDILNPVVREKHGKLAAGFGIFSNAILVAIKLIFGIMIKSISMIGDSINNLSDGANSLITLIGFKMSSKPADKEHPFGHQRIEYITGLIVSIVVVALAIVLGYESVVKLINPVVINHTIPSLIILGVAVLTAVQTPLFCGEERSDDFFFRELKLFWRAGAVDFLTEVCLPFLTNWLNVGILFTSYI